MGEYANYNGQQVKIGTCENMYYLRFDQREQVQPLPGNVDPVKDAAELRFRFPWPDEDGIPPGSFDDYDRSLAVPNDQPLDSFKHHGTRFTSPGGATAYLPCPLQPVDPAKPLPYPLHLQGMRRTVRIVQQRLWAGRLVLVCDCGECSGRFRLETLEDALPILEALARMAAAPEASELGQVQARFYLEVAKRIGDGYALSEATPAPRIPIWAARLAA